MTPAQARIKRAVREAIARCGGVDGAAATALRSRSTCGSWNNLNEAAFPPAECALAMDEAVLAQGLRPPIVAALTRELGGMFLPLPVLRQARDERVIAAMLSDHCRRSGELQGELAESLKDRAIGAAEARDALVPAEAQLVVLVEMIEWLRAIGGHETSGGRG